MRRGEIYYIARRDTVGSELMKARPGVIVSNDSLNTSSPVVEVVYCTTKPKKDQPTHVEIETTGAPCVVLCEQIDSVSTALVGKRCGTCTDEEMAAICMALHEHFGNVHDEESDVLTIAGGDSSWNMLTHTRSNN